MLRVSFDAAELRRALAVGVAGADDGRRPLRRFYIHWRSETALAWPKMRVDTGGDFRGRRWAPMRPQYTRVTDGVTVPAWGGVPRIRRGWSKSTKGPGRGKSVGTRMRRVTGNVSGKLRPSGRRVHRTSILNQDTGALRNAVLDGGVVGKNELRIGFDLPIYAYRILRELARNPLFFTRADAEALLSICREYWQSLMRRRT